MMLFLMKLVAGMALVILSVIIALIFEGVDRIVHARMQNRIGPPILQPVYDIIKLMGKESIVPRRAVPWLFNGAPWLAAVAAMMVILYIPIGSLPPILTGNGDMILIAYLFALSAVSMVVAGFASGSPYANVGAQREMVLMMSYELPLALVICTLAWAAYRLGLPGHPFSTETYVIMPLWSALGKVGIVGMCALLLALLAVVPAETGKVPMDIPEAKTEILEGLIAEYSGRNLAMFKITFAVRTLAMCAFVVAIFFPWSLGRAFGFSGFGVYFIDFFWFWAKVFIMQILGVTLLRTSFGRFKIWQASRFYWINVSSLGVAGMILISLDIFI